MKIISSSNNEYILLGNTHTVKCIEASSLKIFINFTKQFNDDNMNSVNEYEHALQLFRSLLTVMIIIVVLIK